MTCFMLAFWAAIAPGSDPATMGRIVRVDPRFDQLVPTNTVIENLADGFDWAEGPVWDKASASLLFSDIPNNTIWRWKEGQGKSVFLKPSGYTGPGRFTGQEPGSNGLAFDAQGRLLICMHGDRRLARKERDGTFTTLADKYQGKRLNSPNDLAVRRNGDIYFSDPPYGLPKAFDDPAREHAHCGVYRLMPDGTVTLLTKELSAPNGIAFSPDEKMLYVANSDNKRPIIMALTVNADGTLARGNVFFDMSEWKKSGKPGSPDGLKVDLAGNVFATGPGGVHVFTPNGTHLGSLETGVATANCGWGDDGKTLYITADKNLCRVKTATRGF